MMRYLLVARCRILGHPQSLHAVDPELSHALMIIVPCGQVVVASPVGDTDRRHLVRLAVVCGLALSFEIELVVHEGDLLVPAHRVVQCVDASEHPVLLGCDPALHVYPSVEQRPLVIARKKLQVRGE